MQKKMRGSQNLLLIVIILIGAIFRFGWHGVHSFSFDEARVSQIALKMVYEGEFARLGMQSSVGVPNFPATVWLYAIPYAIFGPNVQTATWFTGFVSLLAIPAVYQLGRWRWGNWGGLSAAALFALSPFMLVYGRNIWSQNFLAPLTVFWLYAGYRGILPLVTPHPPAAQGPSPLGRGETRAGVENSSLFAESLFPSPLGRRWAAGPDEGMIALAIFIFLSGFIGQVHIAGLAMVLPNAYIFFRFKLWRRIWPVIIGGMAAAICAFPALYTIWRFGDGARADLDATLAEPSVWHHEVWRMMVQLPLNNGWEFVWLGRNYEWPRWLGAAADQAFALLAIMLILAFVLIIQQIVRW
ncbi:MAG: glycosyltransferase family 39 protein, partial [Chloroflexota bacterium]